MTMEVQGMIDEWLLEYVFKHRMRHAVLCKYIQWRHIVCIGGNTSVLFVWAHQPPTSCRCLKGGLMAHTDSTLMLLPMIVCI